MSIPSKVAIKQQSIKSVLIEQSKYYYTYRITNIKPWCPKKYYYGTRSSKIHPVKDLGIKYFSSSRDKQFLLEQKENPQNFKYKIIKIFKTRKEAINLEILLHEKLQVDKNPLFYNKAKQTSTGFYYDQGGWSPENRLMNRLKQTGAKKTKEHCLHISQGKIRAKRKKTEAEKIHHSNMMVGRKCFTDGNTTKKCIPGEEPKGWYRGRTWASRGKLKKNLK